MQNNQIVANTLLLQHQHDDGKTQIELVKQLTELGVWNIEVRREYFLNNLKEMQALNCVKLGKRLTLFYSVPDVIFKSGYINPKLLQYFAEAALFGASYVKLNIGAFDSYQGNLKQELGTIIPKNIQLNVENDQTELSGSAEKIAFFLDAAKKADLNIGFVNDLGNWIFTKQDAVFSSKKLFPYTRYIHLKNYIIENQQVKTVPINDGSLDWKKLLDNFNGTLPIALEYPVNSIEDLKSDIKSLEGYLEKRRIK
ncbi:sugar phosphate isomerase [Oenococcus sp. UCMA 16435]|nr:sugar phosphate isomerase [Oenococcus sp. UCMA 16435]MDI4583762.1 sugar phosphate isomerase [Oenococcus sp. UCMA 14587]